MICPYGITFWSGYAGFGTIEQLANRYLGNYDWALTKLIRAAAATDRV